jgi:hypothetical protein
MQMEIALRGRAWQRKRAVERRIVSGVEIWYERAFRLGVRSRARTWYQREGFLGLTLFLCTPKGVVFPDLVSVIWQNGFRTTGLRRSFDA